LLRSNYEFKRFYADLSSSLYLFENYDEIDLLPVLKQENFYAPESFTVVNSMLEVGYRFNRKLNFTLFGSATIRTTTKSDARNTTFFNIGLRTGLINHHKDI
jgi:hypothetical protein